MAIAAEAQPQEKVISCKEFTLISKSRVFVLLSRKGREGNFL
jgi:hypothetical protein